MKSEDRILTRHHPLDYFERVWVINLKSRPDRRRHMQAEFARIGFSSENLEWFDAVKPDAKEPFESIGARGCFMSHLAVLAKAADQKCGRVLLLEDDVDFASDFNVRMNIIVEQLRITSWDIFYGGGQVDYRMPVSGELASIEPAISIGCTHFVAFGGGAIRRVHDYIEAQLGRPGGDPAGGPMHVDGSYSWARRELSLKTLIATPDVCHQRSSRSDIAPTNWWDEAPGVRTTAGMLRQMKRWMTKTV